MSFILLGILNSQVSGAGGGAYELIESNILTSSASSVTFSSIPQDYKHLQIRYAGRTDRAAAADVLYAQFNSDTGSNYAWHRLQGTGSVVEIGSSTSINKISTGLLAGATTSADIFGAGCLDIVDFANGSKNTTIRNLSGLHGGSTIVSLYSGFWNNTAAVTSINLSCISNFIAGSRFSLYGIRG